ncbi:MAG: ATPase [Bacteroidales bacterium]|nr:ATPase [Bacteroidales bacterium]
MKLIIDCGSTKADWVIINDDKIVIFFQTEGFNPNYTDKNYISSIILNNNVYKAYIQEITDVFFYGSGCGKEENCSMIEGILSSIFVNAKIIVTHDMLAACHAILGDKEGIACILGTGSNSCFYDGNEIIEMSISLGYVLGDEGSANHIGKKIIHDYFYKKMPEDLVQKFESEYHLNISDFIENIYHKNQASKYLAEYSKFAYANKSHDYIKNLCSECFDEFIEYFVLKFKPATETKIGFVGSIAYYFQDILSICFENKGLKINKIVKNPIEGLIDYHSQN